MRYFLFRFQSFTPQILGSCISLLVGGAAIKFLEADKTVWWFYPTGVLIGFIVYSVMGILAGGSARGMIYHTPASEDENNK